MRRLLLLASALVLLAPALPAASDPKPKPPQAGGGGKPKPTPAASLKPVKGVYHPGGGKPAGFKPMKGAPFKYPPGQAYKAWRTGQTLPASVLTPTYAFKDYGAMGLPAPPAGSSWVRYGPDLVLADSRTGKVVDVITQAFF